MTKNELRAMYRGKRSQLSLQQMEKLNDLILINFQKIKLPFINCAHAYLASFKLREVETAGILRYLQFENPNMRVTVPKIDFSTNTLQHIQLGDNIEMIANTYGIDEPSSGNKMDIKDIDLVLVPLLGFDQSGFRVGYGKGFYDRFLHQCRKDVIKVGLSFFTETNEINDINEFDVALDYCVTPNKVFTF